MAGTSSVIYSASPSAVRLNAWAFISATGAGTLALIIASLLVGLPGGLPFFSRTALEHAAAVLHMPLHQNRCVLGHLPLDAGWPET